MITKPFYERLQEVRAQGNVQGPQIAKGVNENAKMIKKLGGLFGTSDTCNCD